MWVGGVTVRENDPEKPTINSVTGVPSGWFDPAKAPSVSVWATDQGMGIDAINIENVGAGGVAICLNAPDCGTAAAPVTANGRSRLLTNRANDR